MQEIRLAKTRLRYETMLYEVKLKNSTNQMFSNFSQSMRNLSFNIRNRLFTYAFFRSLSKSGMIYDFIRNFKKGFRQSG